MTQRRYFSERQREDSPRDITSLGDQTASSLMELISHELLNTKLGSELPKYCDECDDSFGINLEMSIYRASRDIPGVT